MNENVQQLVEKFVFRVQHLMQSHQKQAEHISKLELRTKELLETIRILEKQQEVLKHNDETLITSNILAITDGDKEKAKDRIDRLVREIDKCIAMLDD